VAAILMDLSKAFDCLPHDILLCKLSAYGLSPKSVELLRNYLTGRKQQIKLQGDLSSFIANCNGLKLIWISLHTTEFEPVYQY
jgi:hypothetical protein